MEPDRRDQRAYRVERRASSVAPDWLWGVADGQIAHVEAAGQRRYVVVSEDPRAKLPRTRLGWEPLGAKLSPTGKHVVALPPPADVRVTEMPSQRDVTPDDSRYDEAASPRCSG